MVSDFVLGMVTEVGGMAIGALFVAFSGGCLFKAYCTYRRKHKHRPDPQRGRLV